MTNLPKEPFLEPKGFDYIRHHVAQIAEGSQRIDNPAILRETIAKLVRVIFEVTDIIKTNERTLKAMSATIETLVATVNDALPEHEAEGCPSCAAGVECAVLARRQTMTNLAATAVMHTVRAMTPDRQAPSERSRIIVN